MKFKKIATNIPEDILYTAVHLSGLNQTQTIIEGLKELIDKKRREELLSLGGKLQIKLDLNKTRERHIL